MSMSSIVSESAPRADTAALPPTRPFYWSIRRELWENRSLTIAPAAVAGLMVFGFAISLFSLAKHSEEIRRSLTPDSIAAVTVLPYDITTAAVVVASVIVGFFYCLSALYGERRERSILFWKSLPVSNVTTVLSKAFMPLAVMPVIMFGAIVVMHLAMLLMNTIACALLGLSVSDLWAHVPLFQMEIALLYGVIALALWHAPIYAYLIAVSAWAKKTTILWAVLPPLALVVVEKIAFDTDRVAKLIGYRLNGGFNAAFSEPTFLPLRGVKQAGEQAAAHGGHHGFHTDGVPVFGIAQIDIVGFLSTPGLWAGLIVAAAFLAVSVWLRRTREAI